MQIIKIKPTESFSGTITVPGDKSISHRSAIIAALTKGITEISGYLCSDDCLATLKAVQQLGVAVDGFGTPQVIVRGVGIKGLRQPDKSLNLGNSGTGLRLLAGVVSGCSFNTELTGDKSLCSRPMKRIIVPLTQMGAQINGLQGAPNQCPLEVSGQQLTGIDYQSPVASAQIKSCLLLAGLNAKGITSVTEPNKSRDHTERMLQYFDADISIAGLKVTINSNKALVAKPLIVPGDISSAAFFMVAATIVKNAEVEIKNVGINPTRSKIIDVLNSMGAAIKVKNERVECGESRGDIIIRGRNLKGINISKEDIPGIIDELPIIAVAAAVAKGRTIVNGAQELRVKESDRIKTTADNLKKLGVKIEEKDDGWIIEGGAPLKGSCVKSYGDHRIAMAMIVAGLVSSGETVIEDTEWIETSFPGFMDIIDILRKS